MTAQHCKHRQAEKCSEADAFGVALQQCTCSAMHNAMLLLCESPHAVAATVHIDMQ